MKVDALFSLVVCLGMFHYSLWEMPVRGRAVTCNLKEGLFLNAITGGLGKYGLMFHLFD